MKIIAKQQESTWSQGVKAHGRLMLGDREASR
jgi:hypothetical protein